MVRVPLSVSFVLVLAIFTSLLLLNGCILNPSTYAKPGDAPPADLSAVPASPAPTPVPSTPPTPSINASIKAQAGVTSDEAKNDLLTLLSRVNSTDMKIRYQLSFKAETAPPASIWSFYRKSNSSRTDQTIDGVDARSYSLSSGRFFCAVHPSGWVCDNSTQAPVEIGLDVSPNAALATNSGNFSILPPQTIADVKSSCYRILGGNRSTVSGYLLTPNSTDLCLSPQGVLLYSHAQGSAEGAPFEYTLTALEYSTEPMDSDFELPAALYAPAPPHLDLIFYDVGFGDATLAQSDNFTMLIDTGTPNSSESLAQSLLQRDVSKIDVLLISSWDVGKLGGLDSIFRRFTVSEIWVPHDPPDNRVFDYPWLAMHQIAVPIRNVSVGDSFQFGPVSLELFNPPQKPYSQSPQANSAVLRLTYHSFCAFMPGDIEDEQQAPLVGLLGDSKCAVYKWPYHGQGRPQVPLFFSKLHPSDVIISVGPNSQGLPSPTTLERLRLANTHIWRTDIQGDLSIHVSQNGSYQITAGTTENEAAQ